MLPTKWIPSTFTFCWPGLVKLQPPQSSMDLSVGVGHVTPGLYPTVWKTFDKTGGWISHPFWKLPKRSKQILTHSDDNSQCFELSSCNITTSRWTKSNAAVYPSLPPCSSAKSRFSKELKVPPVFLHPEPKTPCLWDFRPPNNPPKTDKPKPTHRSTNQSPHPKQPTTATPTSSLARRNQTSAEKRRSPDRCLPDWGDKP